MFQRPERGGPFNSERPRAWRLIGDEDAPAGSDTRAAPANVMPRSVATLASASGSQVGQASAPAPEPAPRRKRVTRKELRAITERLQMTTTISRQCWIDAVDQRRRDLLDAPGTRSQRFVVGSNGAAAISAQRNMPRPPPPDISGPLYQPGLTFERLHLHATIMSQLRQRCKLKDEPRQKSAPTRRPARAASAPPMRDYLDLHALRLELERKEDREGPVRYLARDTCSSSLKRKGTCHFCESHSDLAEHWSAAGECCWCHHETASDEQIKSLVERLSTPTNATKGGLPPCERSNPTWLVPIIGYTKTKGMSSK